MPWYKAGTVSVVQNSTTVTGTNTTFAANSRVGDAFRGPDGSWYEVVNITSDTVLSVSPAYQGASSAAGTYALAPMQGYVKDSADALRALSNQFGTKLAALGATANFEVLPVSNGGTGGASQADARAGLGLGTVATESTVPVAKGGTGGTTPATARAGLLLGAAATAAIVGTVSQSGGIPNGAIMETGTNGAGRYTKYADGRLECTQLITGSLNIAELLNGEYYGSLALAMPATFVGEPHAFASATIGGRLARATFGQWNPANQQITLFISNGSNLGVVSVTMRVLFIGRWF